MKTCKHVFASLALRCFPERRVGSDACMRQAKICNDEGMGHQEVPEYEAPLRAGKDAGIRKGNEKGEDECSLNLMLGQTIFAKGP